MDAITLIAGAKTSLDTATAIVKTYMGAKEAIDEIEQKAKNLELMENILAAKSNILELKSTLIEKDELIKKLEDKLRIEQEMEFEEPVYWHIIDGEKNGPFCQKCYDDNKKLARLQSKSSKYEGTWECTICNTHYETKEYKKGQSERHAARTNRNRTRFRNI